MNRARPDDDLWNELRPAAIRSIQRSDSRIDGNEAAELFDVMRRFTPGMPPADIDDDDER